jgi:ABC-type molybdate transport system substrate-binding protein
MDFARRYHFSLLRFIKNRLSDSIGEILGVKECCLPMAAAVVVTTKAKDADAARAPITFLRTPAAKAVIKAKGMEPPLE